MESDGRTEYGAFRGDGSAYCPAVGALYYAAGNNYPVYLGGYLKAKPVPVFDYSRNEIRFFVIGGDNALYTRTPSVDWQGLGGYLLIPAIDIGSLGYLRGTNNGSALGAATTNYRTGEIVIAGVGGDHGVYYRTMSTGWVGLGGIVTSNPNVITAINGEPAFTAFGSDSATPFIRTLSTGWAPTSWTCAVWGQSGYCN
jgi:hypothetical protein